MIYPCKSRHTAASSNWLLAVSPHDFKHLAFPATCQDLTAACPQNTLPDSSPAHPVALLSSPVCLAPSEQLIPRSSRVLRLTDEVTEDLKNYQSFFLCWRFTPPPFSWMSDKSATKKGRSGDGKGEGRVTFKKVDTPPHPL